MKKTIAILLSLVLIMSIVSIAGVNAASGPSVTVDKKTYELKKGGTFKYKLNLTTPKEIQNCQLIVYYPAEVVKVKSIKFDTDFLGLTPIYNYNIPKYPGEIDVNFTKVDPMNPNKGIDFTKKHMLFEAVFEVIGTGSGKIYVSDKEGEVVLSDVNDKDVIPVFEAVVSGVTAKGSTNKTTAKKKNPIKVTAAKKTLKVKKLKKKNQTFKPLKVKNAKGKVTYKIVKKGTTKKIYKYLKINKKGAVTFKKWKKAKKGNYKIKVTVTAAGNKSYKKGSKSVTVKVKIKK